VRSRTTAAQAATELLVSGRRTQRTSARPRRGRLILVIALVVLSLGAGAWWFSRPTVIFTNNLTAAVDLRVGGEQHRVRPRDQFTVRLMRGQPLDLSWQLQQRLGVAFGDTIAIARPSGRIFVAATAHPRHGAYFAPLITNQTGRPLSIVVNAGLAGSQRCGCVVPPGAFQLGIGYYRLFVNSTVRAEADGRSAVFQNLGSQVNVTEGVVRLLFRAEDLRTTR
jgi:hypothetical protein